MAVHRNTTCKSSVNKSLLPYLLSVSQGYNHSAALMRRGVISNAIAPGFADDGCLVSLASHWNCFVTKACLIFEAISTRVPVR